MTWRAGKAKCRIRRYYLSGLSLAGGAPKCCNRKQKTVGGRKMKSLPRRSFAIAGSLLVLVTSAIVAVADNKSPVPIPELPVSVVSSADTLLLNLHFENADVVEVLRTIAVRGNLELFVQGSVVGNLKSLHLEGVSPEDAIEKVCQAANLVWHIDNKTYVIAMKTSLAPASEKPKQIGLQFIDTPIRQILRMIGESGDINITVDESISDKVSYVRMSNETPESAIEKITRMDNLVWRKVDDKNYVVTKTKEAMGLK